MTACLHRYSGSPPDPAPVSASTWDHYVTLSLSVLAIAAKGKGKWYFTVVPDNYPGKQLSFTLVIQLYVLGLFFF